MSIRFRIAAKTDVGLVRENNEDNFQASSDLSIEPMRWVNNEICSLGEMGVLLVVADGMGGMNAGEVASELAIETVRSAFRPQNLTEEVMKNRFSIEKFMNSVIVDADKRIKAEAKSHPESRGMGTTIVIAWLLNGKLYVSWCGDSRAYVYNPQAGLHQISKDHSYVQSLVDKGAISKEDAFDYPESNIITRCLSDSTNKAKPESLLQPYSVCDNDIIMLCTDGLSGMIRDNEIEAIIRDNEHDMDVCSDLLIRAACDAEGADNITICMCQILQGAGVCNPELYEAFDKRLAGPGQMTEKDFNAIPTKVTKRSGIWHKFLICLILLCVFAGIVVGVVYKHGFHSANNFLPEKDSTKVIRKALARTQRFKATNRSTFDTISITLERGEGDPLIGDRAYPDGQYVLDGGMTITIKDSIVKSVEYAKAKEEKNGSNIDVKAKEIMPSKNPTKDKKKIDTPEIQAPAIVPNNNGAGSPQGEGDNEELTPANGIGYVNTIHEVKIGETLSSISRQFGISVDDIKRLNPSLEGDAIKPGDKLKIRYLRIK